MTIVKPEPGALARLRGMALRLHTSVRRRCCAWLAAVLLLAQCLVAAHACPLLLPAPHPATVASAHAEALPCHDGVPAGERAVCKAQCSGDEQVASQPGAGDNLARLSGWCLVVSMPPPLPDAATPPGFGPGPTGAPPGWPPIYIVNGVLRN